MLTQTGPEPAAQRLAAPPRRLAALGALVALVALLTVVSWPADARGSCSGQGCLPGAGYTFDVQWNCGLIYGSGSGALQQCWEPGSCLGASAPACAHQHTFGWGSADYDGGGGVFVYIQTGNYSWGSVDWNLARACALNGCGDSGDWSYLQVYHNGTGRHTIYGHGKA